MVYSTIVFEHIFQDFIEFLGGEAGTSAEPTESHN
jgi:hypothetical protein